MTGKRVNYSVQDWILQL